MTICEFREFNKIIEFSLTVFTEFREFSDKNICYSSKRVQTCHLKQQGTCDRQDLQIDSNSCFSDLSDSLNSLNSLILVPSVPFRENSIELVDASHGPCKSCNVENHAAS